MKPTIGRVVIFRDKGQPDREFAAVISRVWSDTVINCHVMSDFGVSVSTSVQHESIDGASTTWAWPVREGK